MGTDLSQRNRSSWENSNHRWAAAFTPPRVWMVWDITTAKRHTRLSTGADFIPANISCTQNSNYFYKILSIVGATKMKIILIKLIE